MIVISDTGPLRYLAELGLAHLFSDLFGWVICPGQVIAECRHPKAPESLQMLLASQPIWLDPRGPQRIPVEIQSRLDLGEAAVIALALELRADLVLIDEKCGRLRAKELGLAVAGTLNILAESGRRGHINFFEVARRLKIETNFRVTDSVIRAAWDASKSPD